MGGLSAYLRVSDESVLETGYNQEGEVGQWVSTPTDGWRDVYGLGVKTEERHLLESITCDNQ